MHMDKITEAIAHFVGQFEITLEAVQQRKAYEEFKALQALAEKTPELPDVDVNVKATYELNDFDPHFPMFRCRLSSRSNRRIECLVQSSRNSRSRQPDIVYPGFVTHAALAAARIGSSELALPEIQPEIQPLGSVCSLHQPGQFPVRQRLFQRRRAWTDIHAFNRSQ